MKKMLSIAAVMAAAVPLGLWKSTPSAAEGGVGVEISRNDSRPAGAGPAETFTGDVSVKPLFDANPSRNFSSAEVSFTPCARTAWHTHPAGETLIVTSGSGWVQEWGGQRQDIAAGDVIWTEPGVKHWQRRHSRYGHDPNIAIQATRRRHACPTGCEHVHRRASSRMKSPAHSARQQRPQSAQGSRDGLVDTCPAPQPPPRTGEVAGCRTSSSVHRCLTAGRPSTMRPAHCHRPAQLDSATR